ncbi:MAG: sodium:calcium antiporter [Candidatus Omnitrophica bacterium]|nr:sodium:calcium antiporter [Candidatus Omnitrophota bacterium]
MIWIEFLTCSSLMIFFAYHLCKEGVILSEKTHLEEGLIGMVFLALATSLPEIVTGSSAVFFLGKIGLGYGDIVGSVIVNLMILFLLDYYVGKGRILFKASRLNRITAAGALLLITTILIFSLLRGFGVNIPTFKIIGLESIFIAIVYIVCLEIVRRKSTGNEKNIYDTGESFFKLWIKFIILLCAVIALGVWLAKTGEKISNETDLSQTFIGTLFLGLSTSLPELIVCFAALRAGSINMAIGNIFGSNLFDVVIISFMDGLCTGPILGMLTRGQVIATAVAVVLSAIAVAGLFYKRDTSRRVGWDSTSIFAIGLIGFVILYFVS